MRHFTTADLNKHIGDVTDAARRSPVFITHHRKPRFVLMSIDDYNALRRQQTDDHRQAFTLDTIPDDVADGLIALADQYDREDGKDG